jgi:hypothetical protein
VIRGSLDLDLEFLRDASGNLTECCRTSIPSGTREVDILEGEGLGYTRWLDARFRIPSRGRGLGLGWRSCRRRQGRESVVGASVEVLLGRLTRSSRSRGSRTRLPRQAGERIRGTFEFVPLLLAFAKKAGQNPSGRHSQKHLPSHGAHANQRVTDLKLSGRKWHRSLIQTEEPAGVEYTGVRITMKPVTGKPGEKENESYCWPCS